MNLIVMKLGDNDNHIQTSSRIKIERAFITNLKCL